MRLKTESCLSVVCTVYSVTRCLVKEFILEWRKCNYEGNNENEYFMHVNLEHVHPVCKFDDDTDDDEPPRKRCP